MTDWKYDEINGVIVDVYPDTSEIMDIDTDIVLDESLDLSIAERQAAREGEN